MSARCAHSHVGARASREQQSRIRQHYEVSNFASNRETKDTLYKSPGKQLRTYATQRRRVEQQVDRNYKSATPSRLTSHVISCSSSRCDIVAVDASTTTNDDITCSSLFKIVGFISISLFRGVTAFHVTEHFCYTYNIILRFPMS